MDKKTLISSLKSSAIAVIATAALIFGLNYIAYRQDDPDKLIGIFAYAVIVIAAALIGIICMLICSENGYLCTLLSCFEYSLVYTVISVLFGGKGAMILIRCIIVFGVAFLFSLIFKPRKQKAGKAMKKYKKAMKNG